MVLWSEKHPAGSLPYSLIVQTLDNSFLKPAGISGLATDLSV